MKIKTGTLEIHQNIGIDISDITDQIKKLIRMNTIQEGIISLNVIGSTGSLTTIEFEPGVVEDLKDAISRIAPEGLEYKHELAWHDGNGHSHIQAAILGPSISISIIDGSPQLGTWQQIVAINHDNKPRRRKIAWTIIGN